MKQQIGGAARDPVFIDVHEEWSFKDFTNQKHIFAGRAKQLNGITIYKSSFYQEGGPDQDVFPADVENLTLYACNLDNVRIPKGVTVIECSVRRIQMQNDLRMWDVDEN